MANKYEQRRRVLKDSPARGENPYAAPRSGLTDRRRPGSESAGEPLSPALDRPGLTVALCLGLVLLVFIAYGQVARHKFTVCDDNVYVYKNPMVTQGVTWKGIEWAWQDAHAGNWHPLTWMSHMLDWQLFGYWDVATERYITSWAGGHHLMNVLIHCTNAVLLLLALRVMTGALWPSVVVAALFALHPLRVESVAWAAERKDVLCGLFWMATLLAYAFYVRRPRFTESYGGDAMVTIGLYLLVALLFFLGLTAKSMIVSLPCVLILLDIWPLRRWRQAIFPEPRSRSDEPEPNLAAAVGILAEKIPLFLMAGLDCYITVYGQHKGVALNSFEGLPLWARVKNSVISYGEYIRQSFWPNDLAPFYTHPHMIPDGWSPEVHRQAILWSVVLLAITVAVLIGWYKGRSFLAVGWFWYLGTLIPVIGLLQVGTQARADRYTYLPMIGFYIMVAWLLKEVADRWPQSRRALAGAGAVALGLMTAFTFQQASYWINSYVLFEHAVVVSSDPNGISNQKDDEQLRLLKPLQLVHVDVAADQEFNSKNYFAYNHIGIQYDEDSIAMMRTDPVEGQRLADRSAEAFAESIRIKPDYDFGNNNLGVYYARKGEIVLAERYFRGALRSNQRYADAYNNLGIVLAQQGMARQGKEREAFLLEAMKSHLAGLQVQSDRASDRNNLGRVFAQLGDLKRTEGLTQDAQNYYDKAEEQFKAALSFDRAFVGAYISLGGLFAKQGKFAEAAQCFEAAVQFDPKAADAYHALALLYAQLKKFPEAVAAMEQTLRLNPNYPLAKEQLAELRAMLGKP